MEVKSIAEQLLFSTIRVEMRDFSGNTNTATSFIFNYELDTEHHYPFLVTNKHVISEAQEGRLTFIQGHEGEPLLGKGYDLDFHDFSNIWYGHSNNEIDIAISPFLPLVEFIKEADVDIFYRSVSSSFVPSEDALRNLDALEEVIFIGYPNGVWDTKNLLPIMRKGITATPISIDFQGKSQFLIDASVFPGSSGSPVFLYNVGPYVLKGGVTVMGGSRLLFLGVIAQVFYQRDLNEIRTLTLPMTDVPVAVSKQMIDLGLVFKASNIVETIESYLKDKGYLPEVEDTSIANQEQRSGPND